MKHLLIVCACFLCFAFTGCKTTHEIESKGKTTVITHDTTVIYHGGTNTVTTKVPYKL